MTQILTLKKVKQKSKVLESALKTMERRKKHQLVRLRHFLKRINADLNQALAEFPEFSSRESEQTYRDFARSFELFHLQLQQTLARLGTYIDDCFFQEPQNIEDQSLGSWLDYIEDLEDISEERQRQLAKIYEASLLMLIELLDTVTRINDLQFPEANNKKERLCREKLQSLKAKTNQIGHKISVSLGDRGVESIKLTIDQYPPPETTRIVSREDNKKSDNIVISKILERGYKWRGVKVLRKVEVIVKTGDNQYG